MAILIYYTNIFLKKVIYLKKKRVIIPSIIIGLVLLLSAAFFIYVSTDKYYADETALSAAVSDSTVTVTKENGRMIFAPKSYDYGLIFYPGAKVEHSSYAPLMKELAKNNILCIIVEMPFDLAVFDINAANSVKDEFHLVRHWYIGGHSLGGYIASSYADKHRDELDGLILLAAYTNSDLTDSSLDVISIYGSNDKVLNMKKYKDSYSFLPSDTKELVIQGGCHSFFGSYGTQKGDGIPEISSSEQIRQTVDFIEENI